MKGGKTAPRSDPPSASPPVALHAAACTEDTPAPGLKVLQPKRGYRWGVEVYALAGFALGIGAPDGECPPACAVDLGSGSGIVAFLLASAGWRVRGWERDPGWVQLARASLARSPAARGRVSFREADVRTARGAPADLVVTNPPWFRPDAGPTSPEAHRAAARTMLAGDVEDFLRAGLRLAPRVCVVTRRERLEELRPKPLHPKGAFVARTAWISAGVGLAELRRGEGTPNPVAENLDLTAIYARFRGVGATGRVG